MILNKPNTLSKIELPANFNTILPRYSSGDRVSKITLLKNSNRKYINIVAFKFFI